jgi:hypothetical protein
VGDGLIKVLSNHLPQKSDECPVWPVNIPTKIQLNVYSAIVIPVLLVNELP